MKWFLVFLLLPVKALPPVWLGNIDSAIEKARQEHKYILVSFSGSDWCGPCIRMHQEIFNSEAFGSIADKRLVLLNADFPRLKKNQLPAYQEKLNEALADRYNPKGVFPLTLLLDENGKLVRSWEGFYQAGASSFAQTIESLTNNTP